MNIYYLFYFVQKNILFFLIYFFIKINIYKLIYNSLYGILSWKSHPLVYTNDIVIIIGF